MVWTRLLWSLTWEVWGVAGGGFLNLLADATSSWMILCCGNCPLYYRRTQALTTLATATVTTKNVCRHLPNALPGHKVAPPLPPPKFMNIPALIVNESAEPTTQVVLSLP